MVPSPHSDLQQIRTRLNVIVTMKQAEEGQVQEDASDYPEGDHRGQSSQSLCRGHKQSDQGPKALAGPEGHQIIQGLT